MTTELARREPLSALEKVQDWTKLDPGARKRRAVEALRDEDSGTLESLLAAHLRLYGRRGLQTSRHTVRAYAWGLRALHDFAQGQGVKLHELTPEHARLFVAHLQDEGKPPATVNARLAAGRAFYRALQWVGVVREGYSPFTDVAVTDRTPKHATVKHYDAGQVHKLLAACRTDRERVLVLLGADAGLRAFEVAAVTWEAVDLAARKLEVRDGKGGRTDSVDFTARCAQALQSLRGNGAAAGSVLEISTRRVQQLFERLCELAEVSKHGYHALRHSAGTRIYEATRDLHVVARHLRHATLDMARVYAHLADADYRAAVDKLGEANGKH